MVFKLLTVPFLIFSVFVQLNKLHRINRYYESQQVEEYADVEQLREALSHIPVHFKEQMTETGHTSGMSSFIQI